MSGIGKIVKEGFLIKSPPQERLMAQWQRRYFVLWSSRLMEYYTSKEKRPQDYRKTIDLNNCEDMVAPLPVQNRAFVFKLSINQGSKTRDYYFECGSECEMENWVKCLASVCGFSAVEETDVSPLCSEIENSLTSSQTIHKPKLRPPIPPPKKPSSSSSSPPPMIEEVFYEDPQVLINISPKLEDSVEEVYDNIDDANAIRDLNKFPPPVWKQGEGLQPPPLPPSHPARRYTRSFNQSSEFVKVDEWRAAAPKMPEKIHSNKPTMEGPKCKKHFGSLKDSPRMPKHKVKTKPPAPPAKPWKSGSSDDLLNTNSSELPGGRKIGGGRGGGSAMAGMGFNLKNDPKFGKKLQERRQEVYGDTQSRPRSWGHDQEEYEEVPFTASDENLLDNQATQARSAGPLNSSDEEYVDCQPHEDDDTPAAYLEHVSSPERRGGKGPNTLKREEFLRRPPLPLPPHSSAGNPLPESPPKVPAGSGGGGRPPVAAAAAAFVRPPVASSAGTDAPPPIPKRGNERPPMPLPGAVVDYEDDDEAPPVPRRHPHASDKHNRVHTVGDSNSPSRGLSQPENAIPLPPRSLSPSTPPYPSPTSGGSGPPLPWRGPRQFDSPSPAAANQPKKAKALPVLKQRSLSPDELSSPASAKSEHVFEPFTFGQGPPPPPSTLPQTKRANNRTNCPVPVKNLAATIGGTRPSYETKLPADIGMKPPKKKMIDSYETNLPASIGNRPPLQTKRPEATALAFQIRQQNLDRPLSHQWLLNRLSQNHLLTYQ